MNKLTAQLCMALPQSTYKLISDYNMPQKLYMFSCNWGFSGWSFLLSAGSFLRAAGEGSISLGSRSFPIILELGLLWVQVLWENCGFSVLAVFEAWQPGCILWCSVLWRGTSKPWFVACSCICACGGLCVLSTSQKHLVT